MSTCRGVSVISHPSPLRLHQTHANYYGVDTVQDHPGVTNEGICVSRIYQVKI